MSRRSSGSNHYSTEPLRGRKLWRYGDWGSAGEHIGRHWETVATPILRDAIGHGRPPIHPDDPAYTPRVLISIVADPELAGEVHLSSLAHADSLMIGFDALGRVVAEPADFKWSLETAESRQVSATGLARLLNAGLPRLEAAIGEALGALALAAGVAHPALELVSGSLAVPARAPAQAARPQDETPPDEAPAGKDLVDDLEERQYALVTRDGVFFAPRHQANLHFLHGDWNARKADPLQESQVWFQDFDPIEFFSVLPGWAIAGLLAGYDRTTAQLSTPDGAERYYRLGAGTQGALIRWYTSIFSVEPAAIDVPAELETYRRRHHLWTSTDISLYMDRMMNVRAERETALNEWLREIYGWGRFRTDLARQGINPAELESRGGKRRWGLVFGAIQKAVRARVCSEGLALVTDGQSDMEALELLQGRSAEFGGLAAAVAKHTIGAALADRPHPAVAPSDPPTTDSLVTDD
ncbi:MAG TPA: hypothetical protein VKY74_20555 [Chloroflexia bacterium]|nr:hypothetical protein [Chloroflexia bacterium]